MEYTQLGRTGLKVSRVVLGTMNFGPVTDEADSHAIMDQAHAAGLNFFDTANVYGWGENKGRTEEIIGSWFRQGGGRREKTVLATKVYGDMGEWPNEGRLSALNIRRAAEASLRRLNTDYIDLYQAHAPDADTPLDETLAGLTRFGEIVQRAGKEYVFTVAPDKSTMNPDKMPETYVGDDCAPEAKDAFWERMQDDPPVGYVDLKDELERVQEQDGENLWRPSDTHWAQRGALVYAQELAEALGVPATHRVLTGIAVGVPGDPAEVDERTAARDRRDRARRPLDEWAFGERFGEPFVPASLADSGA